ncbi:MAG: glycosyltransferase family 2 protein [Cytophaga sp.]|uniref:glycosyltransferase family 2 protein n=1 Tax=Cytophaga sp. TaxID=29535 RepID=UPI003F8021CC
MDDREQGLVSIIAISYNHAPFIREALDSVFAQTYQHIELIIVDDASTDQSAAVIQSCIAGKNIQFIRNTANEGNCRSFNKALRLSKGRYIIDFALDDLMYPERVAKQVTLLEQCGNNGVCFTNVDIINTESKIIKQHYPALHHKLHKDFIPQGNVFEALLSRYYINPVSMMFKREVIEALNGYDESLAYEDFDFWIRSSRLFSYVYLPEVLSAKRIVPNSLSGLFYQQRQQHMFQSTLKVCKKAWWLCETEEEKKALVHRCRYEIKQALRYKYTSVVKEYAVILKAIDPLFYVYGIFISAAAYIWK